MQKRDGSVRCTGFSIHVLTAGFILTSAFEKRKNRLSQLNAMADGSIFSESFLLFDVEEVLVCVNGQLTAGSLIAGDDGTVVQLKR